MPRHTVMQLLTVIMLASLCAGQGRAAGADAAPRFQASCVELEPWGFESTGTGVACDFMAYLADRVGLALHTDVRPLARVLPELRNGSIDMTMIASGGGREAWALPVCVPATVRVMIAYLKGAAPVTRIEDFLDKRIGTLHGSFVLDRVLSQGSYIRVELPTMKQGFRMLESRRLEATFCVQPGCVPVMKSIDLDPALVGLLPVDELPFAVMLSRRSALAQTPEILAKLHDVCISAEAQKKLEDLLSPYE